MMNGQQTMRMAKSKIESTLLKYENIQQMNNHISWYSPKIISTIFYLYLMNKYKIQCLLRPSLHNTLGFDVGLSVGTYHYLLEQRADLAKNLATCIHTKSPDILPFLLTINPFGYITNGHANILIFRNKDFVLERYEPHGKEYMNDPKVNAYINRFITLFGDEVNANLTAMGETRRLKVVFSEETCPSIGFQTVEEHIHEPDESGKCLAWSLFFMELVMKNPQMTSSEIINEVYSQIAKGVSSKGPTNHFTVKLKKIIRGYIIYINQTLIKHLSSLFDREFSISEFYNILNDPSRATEKLDIFFNLEYMLEIECDVLTYGSMDETERAYNAILETETKPELTRKIQIKLFLLRKFSEFKHNVSPDNTPSSLSKISPMK